MAPLAIPDVGIEPVPAELRRFKFFDSFVLWFNLGISLLLPVVAAFLVPGLSFLRASFAVLVGVVIGNAMLGYAGYMGARTGAPAMVLYRPSFGRAGSYVPTVLNVLQNIGWGAFELIVIATAASAVSKRLFGFSVRPVWTLVFGAIMTLMAVGGPLVVVREWLRRYAIWFVLASSVYLTAYILATSSLSAMVHMHSTGAPFWPGVDLVVAMPISWIPLVADYTRFGRDGRSALAGSGVGYGLAQGWFYMLGVLLIVSKVAHDLADTNAFVTAVLAVPLGVLIMSVLAVGELDKPFANIYSASVSVQNVFPRLRQKHIAVVIGALCTVLALSVPLGQYQNFLLLIGAVFVPLFGVLASHYAIVRRGYGEDEIYAEPRGVRPWGVIAWLAGFATYNWLNPGTVTWWVSAMKSVFGTPPTFMSASIASFVVAFALQGAERLVTRRRTPVASG